MSIRHCSLFLKPPSAAYHIYGSTSRAVDLRSGPIITSKPGTCMSAMQRPAGEDEQPLREVTMKAGDILRFKEDRSGLSKMKCLSPQHNPVRVEKKFPKNQCCFSQMSELVSYSVLFEIVSTTGHNWTAHSPVAPRMKFEPTVIRY